MSEASTSNPRAPSPWRRRLIVTALIAAALGLVWSQLPKGSYPTDLSRIGQGQAVLVLAMDGNYQTGASVMHLLHGLRREFDGTVHFMAAPLALPEVQRFARQHQAGDGTVLLFDGSGQRVAVLHAPQTEDELRQALQQAFGR